jgi:hypothetical protein
MAEYTIQIDDELVTDPVLKQELSRAVELVLQSARQRHFGKNHFNGRGFDAEAVRHTADLKERQKAEHEAAFGGKSS